jgi:hypothetical protein
MILSAMRNRPRGLIQRSYSSSHFGMAVDLWLVMAGLVPAMTVAAKIGAAGAAFHNW